MPSPAGEEEGPHGGGCGLAAGCHRDGRSLASGGWAHGLTGRARPEQQGELEVGRGEGSPAVSGRRVARTKQNESFFMCNQWQWWVIYLNSTKFGFGRVPPEALHENHGVGGCSTIFLEQIHGGAARAGCVWLTIFGAKLVFWIRSYVELCQTRPKYLIPIDLMCASCFGCGRGFVNGLATFESVCTLQTFTSPLSTK
jgi:hypothetical protein